MVISVESKPSSDAADWNLYYEYSSAGRLEGRFQAAVLAGGRDRGLLCDLPDLC